VLYIFRQTCYWIGVTNSYLGIITARGLETLVLETEHAAPFLFRRMARQPRGEAMGCWAVLDEKTARDLTRQVAARRFEEALRQLSIRALHLGTLLPPTQEDNLMKSAI
jgi:hypothetical protein